MTRAIMTGSSALLALVGVGWLFLPGAVAGALGHGGGGGEELLQLLAAGPLAFAMCNWLGRGAIYGGIYGKPIVAGNFLHAALLTETFVTLLVAEATPVAWAGTVGSLAYLGAFTRLMFWPPWGVRRDASSDAGA